MSALFQFTFDPLSFTAGSAAAFAVLFAVLRTSLLKLRELQQITDAAKELSGRNMVMLVEFNENGPSTVFVLPTEAVALLKKSQDNCDCPSCRVRREGGAE